MSTVNERPNARAALAGIRGPRPATLELQSKMARTAEGSLSCCPIPGCGRPPEARAGLGVSLIYCRYHAQAHNRHGCHWKRTYTATVLEPYRRAARQFIRRHPHDTWIVHALFSLAELLRNAGPVHRVVDTYRMAPHDKARVALARMRRREVPPETLLVTHLAVCCAIEMDPLKPGSETENYRQVQTAKACARLASSDRADYLPAARRRYARSTGLVLVHLGRMIERECEHVRGYHLAAILAAAAAKRAAGGGA